MLLQRTALLNPFVHSDILIVLTMWSAEVYAMHASYARQSSQPSQPRGIINI